MAENRVLKKAKENRSALSEMQQKPSLSDTFTQALVGFLPLIAGLGSSEDTAALAPVGLQAMQQLGQSQAQERADNNALNAQALDTAQAQVQSEDASMAAAAKEAALNQRQEKDLSSKEKIAQESQMGQDRRLDKQLSGQMQEASLRISQSQKAASNSFTSDLRKEYTSNPVTKSSLAIAGAYENIKTAADSGIGDINSLYSFIKILDPSSTVREGEVQLGQGADPLADRLANLYNAKVKGRITSPQFKKDLNEQVDIIMSNQMKKQAQVDSQYTDIANRSGALPENVINKAYSAKIAPAVITKDQALAELAKRKAARGK